MATLTGKIIADFTTSLNASIQIAGTTGTLQSIVDDDGVNLPNGRYYFTLDGDNSQKEHISCTLTGTALSAIKSVSRQGVETSGTVRSHRLGATVTITDFAHILQINNLVNGTTSLDSATPLKYDGTADMTGDVNKLATVKLVQDTAIAGGADASSTVKGISKLSINPVSATDPIAVGDNDTRVPTQSENDALNGTSGTPSNTNRFVTNDDTVGTGLVQRASALANYTLAKSTFTAGEDITAGNALHITKYAQTDGGVLFDTQTAVNYSSVTNQTLSFTVGNNSNRLLLVKVVSSAVPTNVTYNGVAMTLVISQAFSATYTMYLYKLVAPATGANNIVVTSTAIFQIAASSYYNVHQANNVEASVGSNSAVASPAISLSITTLSECALVFGTYSTVGGVDGSPGTGALSSTGKYSASFNGSNVNSFFNTTGAVRASVTGDTGVFNETQSRSITLSYTNTSSGISDLAAIVISIAAATAPAVGVVKTNASVATKNEPLIDFIGFADATVSKGASVSVTYAGKYSSLSGLTPGRKQYLTNTPGTLSVTPGTYAKTIGFATSASEVIIGQQNSITGAAISKTINYTFTAECDGFAYLEAASGTATIITGGLTYQIANTGAAITVPLIVPVFRGNTYAFNNAGINHRFIPSA